MIEMVKEHTNDKPCERCRELVLKELWEAGLLQDEDVDEIMLNGDDE